MPKVVTEFSTDSGDPVRVEIEAPEGQGPVHVGRGGDVVEKASRSFNEALAGLRPIAEGILAQTTDLARAPKGVEVSFGIRLSGEMGVILASSSAEAHVEVKLSWERDA